MNQRNDPKPETFALDELRSPWGIVGVSPAILDVLHQVERVAGTPTTVLLLGETGTGKELVAKAIHERSPRAGSAFLRVNCGALPSALLESELFGHEKGAFTGAVARRIGRFEEAERGTILLDEIGELPLDMQPKLLRLLQEREYQRLGSNRTAHADVRVIVATHRDLYGMCQKQLFRPDLFYRLNVFPIRLPALRERREDIPLLAAHLVPRLAKRFGRRAPSLGAQSLARLQQYDWPGNVRELENVLERALIRSDGPELNVELGSGFQGSSPTVHSRRDESFEAAARAHIVSVLRSTRGVVSGPHGAAARLGLKRSTLNFKLKKLGIVPAALRATRTSWELDDEAL